MTEGTFSFWFKPSETLSPGSDIQTILAKNEPDSNDGDWWIGHGLSNHKKSGQLEMMIQSSEKYKDRVIRTKKILWPSSKWHFLVFSFKGGKSGNLKVFVDGILDNTMEQSNIIGNNHQPLYIGINKGDLPEYAYPVSGVISSLKIFDRQLSDQEIRRLYNDNNYLPSGMLFDRVK